MAASHSDPAPIAPIAPAGLRRVVHARGQPNCCSFRERAVCRSAKFSTSLPRFRAGTSERATRVHTEPERACNVNHRRGTAPVPKPSSRRNKRPFSEAVLPCIGAARSVSRRVKSSIHSPLDPSRDHNALRDYPLRDCQGHSPNKRYPADKHQGHYSLPGASGSTTELLLPSASPRDH